MSGTVIEKKPFVNKRNANQRRIEEDEAALKQHQDQQDALKQEDAPVANKEEETFKKRYGDLRRYQQEQAEEFRKEIKALKDQLEASTRQEIKLPKSESEIEAWAAQYPDVARIIESIAIKKAREQAQELETRFRQVDELSLAAKKEKAEAELARQHPDWTQIRETDEFHEWAEQQPKWIQDALYENETDAKAVSRVIDLYKADVGATKKPERRGNGAAESVNVRGGRNAPAATDPDLIYESAVARMSSREYEKSQDKIMEAMSKGKFVYDLSGAAR